MNRPVVVVTRKLPAEVEAELQKDFDARLNPNDTPLTPEQLQDLVFGAPDAAQLVGRPAALDLAADLVVVDEFARPPVRLEQLREHFHGRGVF